MSFDLVFYKNNYENKTIEELNNNSLLLLNHFEIKNQLYKIIKNIDNIDIAIKNKKLIDTKDISKIIVLVMAAMQIFNITKKTKIIQT